jgi:hypothetical protein
MSEVAVKMMLATASQLVETYAEKVTRSMIAGTALQITSFRAQTAHRRACCWISSRFRRRCEEVNPAVDAEAAHDASGVLALGARVGWSQGIGREKPHSYGGAASGGRIRRMNAAASERRIRAR